MSEIADARVVVPALPPRCVPRPRLSRELAAATRRPLTLVSAGAGSGKTVMLSEWAAAQAVRPAWISLAKADNDPTRFWLLVAEALDAAGRPSVDREVDEFRAVPADGAAVTVDPYLAALDPGRSLVLVLDDAHLLTDPLILDGLDGLLRRSRTQLRLVLSARHDPLLALHRYRLAGQMSELRARELAMSRSEARALLSAHGVRLSARELAVLAARTEGWVAGLRLSAMSMEGTEHPAEFVSEFAMDQGSVGEYLMNEVLDRQPDEVRTLLIETSFLDTVNGELAAAVTGFPDAGATLAELSRTNAFVLPLDRAAGSFRYHQLLAEILRYLLRRESPEHRAELVRRASDWYDQHGDPAAALHLAVDGQDWPHAAALLVQGGFARAFVDNDALSYLRCGELADTVSGGEPDLVLARAALQARGGQVELAKRGLDHLRGFFAGPGDDAAALTLALTEFVIARAEHRYSDLEVLADRISSTQAPHPTPALTAAVRFELGCAHFWEGRYDDTDAVLLDALDLAVLAGHAGLQVRCLAQLALGHAHWGRLRACERDEAAAESLVDDTDGPPAPATLHLASAVRAFYQADFEASARSLERAEVAVPMGADADATAAVRLFRGVLHASRGQVAAARTALAAPLESASTLAEDFRVAVLAGIETALGRPNAAVKLLGGDRARRSPSAALATARAYLALGDLRRAEDALRPTVSSVDNAPTRIMLIEALMTQAQISLAREDEPAAVEHLVRACELSAGEIDLPFARVADIFDDLVSRHASLAALWPTLASGPLTAPPVDDARPADARLPEALTDRERTVLRWLSTTMSTTEIADELCLSVNTVKTHISAIYRKLAAAKRRDAVLRARTLELL